MTLVHMVYLLYLRRSSMDSRRLSEWNYCKKKKGRNIMTLQEGQHTVINPILNALLITMNYAKCIKNNYTATMHESPEQLKKYTPFVQSLFFESNPWSKYTF